MRYLLDTNICIYAIKQRPSQVIARLREHAPQGLGISSISVAELFFGAARSGSSKNLAALRQFLEPLEIADFDLAAAEVYGRIRLALEQAGTPIGPLDTLIAAHAMSRNVTVVTHNTGEFARVPGLKVANWAAE